MLNIKARLYKDLIMDTSWYPENAEFRLWVDKDWNEFEAPLRIHNVNSKSTQKVIMEIRPRLDSVSIFICVDKFYPESFKIDITFDHENNREVINFVSLLIKIAQDGEFDPDWFDCFNRAEVFNTDNLTIPTIPFSQDRWDYLKVPAGTSVEEAMNHLSHLTGLHMEYRSRIVSWGKDQYGDEQIEEVMSASLTNPANGRKLQYKWSIYEPYSYIGPYVRGYGFDFYENDDKVPYEVKNENNKPFIATMGAWLMGF